MRNLVNDKVRYNSITFNAVRFERTVWICRLVVYFSIGFLSEFQAIYTQNLPPSARTPMHSLISGIDYGSHAVSNNTFY